MLTILLIILMAAIIVAVEIPALKKEKNRKDTIIFSVLLVIGAVFGACWGLGVIFPSPLQLLTVIYKPPYDFIMRLLN